MRPPRDSEIAVASGDGLTAYDRARRMLRLGALANDESAVAAQLIIDVPKKPLRDPSTVNKQAMTQAVLYLRKKYSEG